MESKPIIIVRNISKIYPQKPQLMRMRDDTLFSYLNKKIFRKANKPIPFRALKKVSFTVNAGESVGIIGFNGAGKSTLLRVITGITAPSRGKVKVKGKYGELFALNSGFNKDLSGRKNIFLIAAIKGIPQKEIEKKVDDIIAFSELDDFIDQPVKVYSNGMRSRLGFSILINILPDIIFIDEALATGDHKFRKKCQIRLDELVKQNRTLMIVSHSTANILGMCSRVLWLDKGKLIMDGPAKEVIEAYESNKKIRKRKKKV
jgi:ABC-type polysaccharide/polyol phosphate transport system ATPase subunit